MSSLSIASLKYITGADLAQRLRNGPPSRDDIAVIDVRGSDYIGGHILGCINVPSDTHDYAMPELVRKLQDKKVVVFHCALSQQRGPKAALGYLRAKETAERSSQEGTTDDENKGKDTSTSEQGNQEVFVLKGGFSEWQQTYGEDKDLTEAFVKDLWEDDD